MKFFVKAFPKDSNDALEKILSATTTIEYTFDSDNPYIFANVAYVQHPSELQDETK